LIKVLDKKVKQGYIIIRNYGTKPTRREGIMTELTKHYYENSIYITGNQLTEEDQTKGIEYKSYLDTIAADDGNTYDARAQLKYEDGEIIVESYEYLDEFSDWVRMDEDREDLQEYLNDNYKWEQL
jgi:hypothetical protein